MKSGEILKLVVLLLMVFGPSVAKAMERAAKRRAAAAPPPPPAFEPPPPPPPRRRTTVPPPPPPFMAEERRIVVRAAPQPAAAEPPAPRATPAGDAPRLAPARPALARALFADRDAVRRAVVASEILGPPLSERPAR